MCDSIHRLDDDDNGNLTYCLLLVYIQIAQSLRRFGISDTSENLLVIKVGGESGEVQQDMINNVKGELVPLSELDQMHDIKSIQKVKKMRGKLSWHATEGLM